MYLVGERLDSDIPHAVLEGQTHTPHEGINIAIMFFSGPPNTQCLQSICNTTKRLTQQITLQF